MSKNFKDFLENYKLQMKNKALEPEFFILKNIKEIPQNIESVRDYALTLECEHSGNNKKIYNDEELIKAFSMTQKEIDETIEGMVELECKLGENCPLCKNLLISEGTFDEAEKISKHPEKFKTYSNFSEILEEVKKEN